MPDAILDVDRLWREFDHDPELFKEMRARLRPDYEEQRRETQQALDNGNAEQVAFWAHKIAGTVGVFSAVAARNQALKVEDDARSANLPAAVGSLLELDRSFSDLEIELSQLA